MRVCPRALDAEVVRSVAEGAASAALLVAAREVARHVAMRWRGLSEQDREDVESLVVLVVATGFERLPSVGAHAYLWRCARNACSTVMRERHRQLGIRLELWLSGRGW